MADGVHTLDPGDGIGGLEDLGDAIGAGELGGQLVCHLPGLLIDLGEMSVQPTVVEQGVVEGAAVLFQIVRPPSAPKAQGRRGGLALPGDQIAVAHQFVVEARPVIVDISRRSATNQMIRVDDYAHPVFYLDRCAIWAGEIR